MGESMRFGNMSTVIMKNINPGPPYAEYRTGAAYDVDTRVASEAKRLGQGRQCGLQFPLAQPTMELAPRRQG